ncbi:MAG: ROK family transcriptional regulator [Muribaculaceae bacterium]|nr:ROK family transcriptional regulator [Muribaculaceae bacterium]
MTLASILNTERGYNKKKIITSFFYNLNSTIPELAKELNLSIPTVTKLVNEMVEDGILNDYGKSESKTGRKPSTYGLNPQSGYFLGIDVKKRHINIGLCNFNGEIVRQDFEIAYTEQNSSIEELHEICQIALDFIKGTGIEKSKILNAGVNISGRVNPSTGYSYSTFIFSETPLTEIISEKIGIPVCIENDTRAMTYGECMKGSIVNGERNILYVNLGWGLGLGIVINGELYEGKSGFAGEFGHISAFDNEILCHCGKKGCLETEVSGWALHREILSNIKDGKVSILSQKAANNENITLHDIIEATNSEDFLCIDQLEVIGEKLGKQLANMINIFNPELVVIGGTLSEAGEYLIQPIRQAVKKYSLKLVNSDSKIICSKLHEKAGIIGACMTARRQMFEQH